MVIDTSYQIGQTVGTKLRAARLAKKYTQSRLAQPDFSVSYISAIERGQIQPSLRALEILAKRLDMSSADLLPQPGQMGSVLTQTSRATSLEGRERDMLFLEARIALYQRDPVEAIRLLNILLAQKGSKEQELTVYHLLGWAYLKEGYLQESEQALAVAARLAREPKDVYYAHILHLQGTVYSAMHNAAQALQLQKESLAILEQEPEDARDIFLLASIYNDLGQYYTQHNQLDMALKMFQLALSVMPGRTTSERRAATKANYEALAQTYRARKASLLAQVTDYKWFAVDFLTRLPALRSAIQHSLGKALLKSQSDEAYTSLLTAVQEGNAQQDPLSHASASVHLAAWFIAREQFSKAEPYLRQAQELAEPFGETLIAADALLLQGQLAYALQDTSAGDLYFEHGLAILEKLGAQEELIEQLANYAHILEEHGSIQKAILYWRRAYEYRQKE